MENEEEMFTYTHVNVSTIHAYISIYVHINLFKTLPNYKRASLAHTDLTRRWHQVDTNRGDDDQGAVEVLCIFIEDKRPFNISQNAKLAKYKCIPYQIILQHGLLSTLGLTSSGAMESFLAFSRCVPIAYLYMMHNMNVSWLKF